MAKKLTPQLGSSLTCDFEEKTWTFEMKEGFKVKSGLYAIVPFDDYLELINATQGISNSMKAHPDCTEDSEFEGMVSRCEEALNNLHSIK